jgi:hypothetical protein
MKHTQSNNEKNDKLSVGCTRLCNHWKHHPHVSGLHKQNMMLCFCCVSAASHDPFLFLLLLTMPFSLLVACLLFEFSFGSPYHCCVIMLGQALSCHAHQL